VRILGYTRTFVINPAQLVSLGKWNVDAAMVWAYRYCGEKQEMHKNVGGETSQIFPTLKTEKMVRDIIQMDF